VRGHAKEKVFPPCIQCSFALEPAVDLPQAVALFHDAGCGTRSFSRAGNSMSPPGVPSVAGGRSAGSNESTFFTALRSSFR
jgi:hypothetical protein